MKILCLHPAVSMRTIRQMKVLKKEGHEIHLRYLGYGASARMANDAEVWTTKAPLFKKDYRGSHFIRTLYPCVYRKVIKWAEREGFDVIHSASMSDVLGAAAAMYAEIPTIFDARETVSSYDSIRLMRNYIPSSLLKYSTVRMTGGQWILSRLYNLEKTAIELSRGRVFVSDYALQLALKKYNFDLDKTIILYNYLPMEDYPKVKKEKLSVKDGETHLVYSSGLSISDYRGEVPGFLRDLADRKLHVHIHGIFEDEETKRVYEDLAKSPYIHLEKTLPPHELISELTKYDYGLIYYPKHKETLMLHTSLPNKFFEYLAAGLPILASPYMSMKMFIEKYNVGIVFENADDLIEKLSESDMKGISNPEDFALDEHIQELEKLYRNI